MLGKGVVWNENCPKAAVCGPAMAALWKHCWHNGPRPGPMVAAKLESTVGAVSRLLLRLRQKAAISRAAAAIWVRLSTPVEDQWIAQPPSRRQNKPLNQLRCALGVKCRVHASKWRASEVIGKGHVSLMRNLPKSEWHSELGVAWDRNQQNWGCASGAACSGATRRSDA